MLTRCQHCWLAGAQVARPAQLVERLAGLAFAVKSQLVV
jgi:hypothetical protein